MIRMSSAWARMGGRKTSSVLRGSTSRSTTRSGSRRSESTASRPGPQPQAQSPSQSPFTLPGLPNTSRDSSLSTDASTSESATVGAAIPLQPKSESVLQKSIPGPTWLWLEPIYTPFRAYGRVHQRRPYLTQFVSALVIYLIGDLVAQGIGSMVGDDTGIAPKENTIARSGGVVEGAEHQEMGRLESWFRNRDWQRTGRALLIGGVAAIPGFKWFVWLSNSFNYRSKIASLSVKVLINQTFFTPIFNTYFFSMQHLLSTPWSLVSFDSLATHVTNTVPTSIINSCKIWPAVTAFSFAFVKLEYRSLVAGVVAIGWQTYLSLLDQREKRREREEKEEKAGVKVVAGV